MSSTQSAMTIDAFLQMPENERFELIDGEPVMMMAESPWEHGVVQQRLQERLGAFVRAARLGGVFPESVPYRVHVPDRPGDHRDIRKCDVSFIRGKTEKQLYRQMTHHGAPTLAVETLSRHDSLAKAREKVRMWLHNGAVTVWLLLDHANAEITHADGRSARSLGPEDHLTDDVLLPGFAVRLRDLYPGFDDDEAEDEGSAAS